MAERTEVKLTKDKIDMYGVSLYMSATIGDWKRSISVSPIDYKLFKTPLYRDKLHADLVKNIEHAIKENE